MKRLGGPICFALSLGACLDIGDAEPVGGPKGQAGDAGVGVEGGCWQTKYADCDGNEANGCETAIDTLDNCGACGAVCGIPSNGSADCNGGTCMQTCAAGFDNCDGDWGNGCESLSSVTNCGSCGVPCAGTCSTGKCCKPPQSACSSNDECCGANCHQGVCCRSTMSDCSTPSDCCVEYCTNGTCCKPSGVACNQSGTCCSGTCSNGVCA